jgi:paraquat-inducible protein A
MNSLIACHGCDLLVDVGGIDHQARADCPRCGHFLTRRLDDGFARTLAYAVSGAIFLLVANLFPFLTLEAQGLSSSMTLPQTALALYKYGMPYLSVLVAGFIILLPATLIGLLVAICLPLSNSRSVPWLGSCAHLFFLCYNWAMVEVFIIGVIVSLVKLANMAEVTLGISFWAYVGFSLCFTACLATLDRFQTWQAIEELETL